VDDEEIHARLSALLAEQSCKHARISHHNHREQTPQQSELLRLKMEKYKTKLRLLLKAFNFEQSLIAIHIVCLYEN